MFCEFAAGVLKAYKLRFLFSMCLWSKVLLLKSVRLKLVLFQLHAAQSLTFKSLRFRIRA